MAIAIVTEPDLIARVRARDAAAITELFDRHWAAAWRAAFVITGSRADADDIAQDGFLAAIDRLGRFDGRWPFAAWLNRIVVNRALDHLRRCKRLVAIDAAAGARAAPWPAADPGVARALRQLDVDRRVVVVLRYGLDWTPAEIALHLGVPVGTVHSRLARALEDLRTLMEVDRDV